jgi:hypothetical protein
MLLSVQGLDEFETDDLVSSMQESIEEVVCLNQPDEYSCIVDISSVNDQPLISRRILSTRELVGLLKFDWIARILFPTARQNAEDAANSVANSVSSALNDAAADNSIVTSFVSKATTNTVKNLTFGPASVTYQPRQVELTVLSGNNQLKEGGERCSKDKECASNKCKRRGLFGKKYCEVRPWI